VGRGELGGDVVDKEDKEDEEDEEKKEVEDVEDEKKSDISFGGDRSPESVLVPGDEGEGAVK
jgi:hypothetical protein